MGNQVKVLLTSKSVAIANGYADGIILAYFYFLTGSTGVLVQQTAFHKLGSRVGIVSDAVVNVRLTFPQGVPEYIRVFRRIFTKICTKRIYNLHIKFKNNRNADVKK